MSAYANFLFEVGMLNRTPRTGFAFLGSGEQSVAEHSFRMLHIAWLLARLIDEPLDELHLLHLVMFHDLPETRTGDFNYVQHKYNRVDEAKLNAELAQQLPFGEQIIALEQEFEARATPEARVANDADQLELLLMLKELQDLNNPRAAEWMVSARARLKTDAGKQLAQDILDTRSDAWWFGNKDDPHWVHRGKPNE
jgi:putative hydrolase of HD superfamily